MKKYYLLKATSKDIAKLIQYKLASILDYDKEITPEEKESITNFVKKSIPNQINDYKVIEIDNKIIGCLYLEPYQDGILLNEIYLEEDYRNQGIGTDIIKNILQNNSKIYLWVYKENKKALKLYQSLNFTIKETEEKRYLMVFKK